MKKKDVIAPHNVAPADKTAAKIIRPGENESFRPINQRLANALDARRSPRDFAIPLGFYANLRRSKS